MSTNPNMKGLLLEMNENKHFGRTKWIATASTTEIVRFPTKIAFPIKDKLICSSTIHNKVTIELQWQIRVIETQLVLFIKTSMNHFLNPQKIQTKTLLNLDFQVNLMSLSRIRIIFWNKVNLLTPWLILRPNEAMFQAIRLNMDKSSRLFIRMSHFIILLLRRLLTVIWMVFQVRVDRVVLIQRVDR